MKKNNIWIKYKSINVFKTNKNKLSSRVNNNFFNQKQLKENHVAITVDYSNINFKDFLIFKGKNNLIKNYPHTPGIDASGKIKFSKSKNFKKNDKVYIIGYPLGVELNGAFSEIITVPERWVKKLPKDFSTKEIMAIGTSGYTAISAFNKAYKIILKNKKKSVLVTGATGNVGMFLLLLLNRAGISIEVLTTKVENSTSLKKMGVSKVHTLNNFLKSPDFPLLNEKYSVIFDNYGGEAVYTSLKYLIKGGLFVSIGNVLGNKSLINILPLILRGISLKGVNTESLNNIERENILKIYKKNKIKNDLLKNIKIISLLDVLKLMKKYNNRQKNKRYLVKV